MKQVFKSSGYRTIIFLFLVWYFAARFQLETPGAFLNVVAGPFETQIECEKLRINFSGGALNISECKEMEKL